MVGESDSTTRSKTGQGLGQVLQRMRNAKDYSSVAKDAGMSTRTIRNIEAGKTIPSSSTLVSLIQALKPTRAQLLELLDVLELTPYLFDWRQNNADEDMDIAHTRQIQIFQGMSYNCFYISSVTTQGDDGLMLTQEQLKIWGLEETESGKLESKATTLKHRYDCMVVCAPRGDTAFFTLTSLETEPMLSDVAYLVLPLPGRPVPEFNAGIGVITSLVKPQDARESHPRCQLIAVVSERYVDVIGEGAIRELCQNWLELPKQTNHYHWEVPDIWERSNLFYKEIHRLYIGGEALA